MDELLPALGVARVHVRGGGAAVAAALARLRRDPGVLYAVRDQQVQAFYTPNDPYVGYQWSLPRVHALEAWDIARGNPSVLIGVLDTGVEATHPDLRDKLVLPGYNALDGSTNTNDGHGHGTHVSGIAAAATDNGVGVAGAGFNSRVVPVKVLSDGGEGSFSSVISGIRWAADHGVKVINMSLGGTVDYPGEAQPLQDAVNYARERGVVVVAAAGNSGNQTPEYPGALENVICVASTDGNDARSGFSTYGSWIDVGAPGSGILSSARGGGYAYYSGTSMATPLVAGEAALLFGYAGLATSPDTIRNAIQSSQDAVTDPTLPGRVNFRAALDRLPRPAPNAAISALWGTGLGETGQPLQDGAPDPHYQIVSGPNGVTAGAAVATNNTWPVGFAWLANTTVSRWISPKADQTQGSPAGTYVYRTVFTVSAGSAASVAINGRFAADDELLDIRLNGASLGTSGAGFDRWISFSISRGFVEGTNTLEFVVSNASTSVNPTGFRVEMSAAGSGTSVANPVIENAGFETPFVGSGGGAYRYNPAGGAWLFDGGAGLSGNDSGFTSGNPSAPQGSQVAFLQGEGSISQFVNNFRAGERYTLTFQAAQRGNSQARYQQIEVFVGGQSLGRFTPSGPAYSPVSVTFSMPVTGGATLRFDGLNPAGGDNTVFIDDVKVVIAP